MHPKNSDLGQHRMNRNLQTDLHGWSSGTCKLTVMGGQLCTIFVGFMGTLPLKNVLQVVVEKAVHNETLAQLKMLEMQCFNPWLTQRSKHVDMLHDQRCLLPRCMVGGVRSLTQTFKVFPPLGDVWACANVVPTGVST